MMTIRCTLVRSVIHDGFFAAAGTPVRLEGMSGTGQVRCAVAAVVGEQGEIRDDFVIHVLPEDLKFDGLIR